MKKLSILLATLTLALSACQTSSLSETEKTPVATVSTSFTGQRTTVDFSKSVIAFTGKSSIINHQGKWTSYGVEITTDPAEPSNLEKATIAVAINLTSVETDSDGLSRHLMKTDFFDTETYPNASFVTQSIRKIGNNQYVLAGDLTMKGKTKPISMNAEITDTYLVTSFDVPRKDFGIGNDTYGEKLLSPLVPVEVKFIFE